jgi:hypothetical protein
LSRQIFLILMLVLFLTAEAGAVDCNTVLEAYNEDIRLYQFKAALDVLQECSESCPEQMNICSLQAISLKATIRNYIDAQRTIAREARESNPGASLRSYKRILEIGRAYGEKSEEALSEAQKELPGLQAEIDRRIADLVRQGEQAIAQNRLDRLRDIIYEIVLLDYGNPKAQDLSQAANKKIEEIVDQESKEIDKLLKTLSQTVAEGRGKSATGNRQRQNKINSVTQNINTRIDASLAMKPGDEKINRLYDQAVRSKDQAQEKGLKVQLKEPDRQLTESPKKVYQRGVDHVNQGNYGLAVEELKQAIERSNFDRETLSSAYVYLGIAYASQMKEVGAAKTPEDKTLRAAAAKSFRWALSFNPKLQLPKGYSQYKSLLEEARHLEDPRVEKAGLFGPK